MSTVAEHLPPSPGTALWPRVGWIFLLLGALFAAGYALTFATTSVFDGSPPRARLFEIAAIGYAHTLGGMIAMLIGPFQLLGALRRRYPGVHRWLGRLYLASVAASGLAGLYLAPGGDTRDTFGIGFIVLALLWLYTGTQAYVAIRRGQVAAHRRWMIRNYALTYAAVTLRLELPLLIAVGGLTPIFALNVVAWLCWVPNLLVVEAWLRRRRTATA